MASLIAPPDRPQPLIAAVAVVLFIVASYAALALVQALHGMATAAEAIAQCRTEVTGTEKRLRRMTRDRDLAVWKAEEAERLMRNAAGNATDEAFKRLRVQDHISALRAETEQLRFQIAAQQQNSITTGAIEKPDPAPVKRRPQRQKPRHQIASRQEQPHDWFKWAEPRP